MLEFMARKRACFRVRLNLLFSLARSRVLQRRFAAALFSLVRKKMPKKYAEGVRTLSTPGDAVKFLRFDGDTGNSTVCGNARMRSLFLHHINIGLTQAVFYEIFGLSLYGDLVLYLSLCG